MFMVIPGILVGVLIAMVALGKTVWKEDYTGDIPDWTMLVIMIASVLLLVAVIFYPANYFCTRNDAWAAEKYYEYVVQPNVIHEVNDYVVVGNKEAAIWQVGELNLVEFNSYIVTTRHWQQVPVIGWSIYPVPEQLKYVRVGE